VHDDWAAQNLRVIRTLMERAALYRRALAPVTLATGALGLAAGAAGWWLDLDGARAFAGFWIGVALAALALSLVIMRRQSLGDGEAFWSAPTRRVAQAMLPALFTGGVAGFVFLLAPWRDPLHAWWLPGIWMLLYGASTHAAGFFMPRGMKVFGWLFTGLGMACVLYINQRFHAAGLPSLRLAHLLMGATFGGLHLAYGCYLAATEKPSPGA
jgi:hypothetical protein